MEFPTRGIRKLRHEDERERWAFTLRGAPGPLRPLVQGYCLFEERRETLPDHQHLPHPHATFIVGLEGRLDVLAPDASRLRIEPGQGILAGLHTRPAHTRSEPVQRGLEIRLTALGAHRLLGGQPMHALANRVFSLDDLLGLQGRELGDRLAHAQSAEACFDWLDAFLVRRLPTGAGPSEALAFAWGELERSHGGVRVGALGKRLGWSRKRMVAEFRAAIGLAPKTAARLLRFHRAMELWKSRPDAGWAPLALECGYHDQAHLAREVRAFTGQTATELARRLLPGAGSVTSAWPERAPEHFDKTRPGRASILAPGRNRS